jgi:hypothetical protein
VYFVPELNRIKYVQEKGLLKALRSEIERSQQNGSILKQCKACSNSLGGGLFFSTKILNEKITSLGLFE